MKKLSLSKDKIRVLLLEGVHDSAVRSFQEAGYKNITRFAHALPQGELKKEIKTAHFLGIRSRSQINAAVLGQAKRLAAVGCFCIGIAMAQVAEWKENLYFFLIVGFLGSFTTMSAFSQQTIDMLYNGRDMNALVYVVASVGSCILGTYIAYTLFKAS